MDDLCRYSGRPFAFIFRYVRHRALSHGVIAGAVLAAVACSITTQYGVKYLVDTLSGADRRNGVWFFKRAASCGRGVIECERCSSAL